MSTEALPDSLRASSEPSADALDRIVAQIEASYESGDLSATLELLSENLLQAWFGLSPEQLLKQLLEIEGAGHQLPATLIAIRDMMLAAAAAAAGSTAAPAHETPRQETEQAVAALGTAVADQRDEYVFDNGQALGLRLQGRPVEALRATEELAQGRGQFQTLFATQGNWGLFVRLQAGLTAMLAGDFEQAEALLEESKLHPSPPSLPFLTRDAHSKSAVLHACFGDPAVAIAELAIADQQPRTKSWIEPALDAQSDVARALVQSQSPAQAIELLEAIPMHALGEMWPFYAYAVRTVFERAGQPSEAVRRLEILDRTRLPRVDCQGFTGSVLPSLLAFSALSAGNTARAKELWQRVDPNLVITMLGSAVFALAAGDARECVRVAMDLRGRTRTMRQLELWRLSLLATGLLVLEDEPGCVEVLRSALMLPRGLSPEEITIFHEEVRDFAERHFDEWPSTPSPQTDSFARISLDFKSGLTEREFEVLTGLSRGLTRAQIGKELFLSVNTVKAHQQSLYRKLGVSSRNAAVLEAEQRGIL